MKNVRQEVIDNVLEESFFPKDVLRSGIWIIRWNGIPLVVQSGKSGWKKKQHASSALSNHIRDHWHRWSSNRGQDGRGQSVREAMKGLNWSDYLDQLKQDGIITFEQI